MIVDLTETGTWPQKFDVTIELAEIDLEDATARLKGSVRASGAIEKHAGWFDVDGLIEADAEVDCSRCLEPIERPLSIEFNARLIRGVSMVDGTDGEVDPKELDLSVLDDDVIDVNEVIREQILLDLPEQIFCSDECKGLCPKCGANRNLIDCKCEEDDIDPRWAALKNLK